MALFFMKKVLEIISQGKFFKLVCAAALVLFAVLTALGGFLAWCALWLTIQHLQGFAVLALLAHQCIYVLVIYMQVHTFLIRAGDIQKLPEGNFTVIPIISVFFKLFGDQAMIACIYIGLISGLLSSALMGQSMGGGMPFMPNLMSMGMHTGMSMGMSMEYGFKAFIISFLYGILSLVVFIIIGFMMLLFFYLLSEGTLLLADIAINIKGIRGSLDGKPAMAGAAAAAEVATAPAAPVFEAPVVFPEPVQVEPPPEPVVESFKCPHCGYKISEDAQFCRNCGSTIEN